ncbi:hypothetical protein Daus18300_006696 [Diaporthe australafricana]|uniref:Uncharacterized protein n=1 Tax=Diaporthe australafricana TaxID=127596 RepID=A0ABR3WS11_9PEZI
MSSNWPKQMLTESECEREMHRAAILKELRSIKEKAASEAAARNWRHAEHPRTDPIIEQEVNRRRSLEDSERQAAGQRERRPRRLEADLEEIEFVEARSRFRRRRDRLRTRWVPTSDTAVKPTIHPEVHESDADDEYEPVESDGEDEYEPDGQDELDSSGSGTRWVSQKYLNETGLCGWGMYVKVYRDQTTDALYFLDNVCEHVWLTDENGDCVLAQEQRYSTPEAVDYVDDV